jgi:TPR repeat protein
MRAPLPHSAGRTRRPPRRALRPALLLGALLGAAALLASPLAAASARTNKEGARESAPVLLSRTGGAAWSDVAELTAAAEKGNPKAQAQLGEMLLRGDPAYQVAADRPKALALLERAARQGESSAAFRLGMLFDDGEGVPQDRPRALAYFRAAAAGGAVEAMHNIGAAYASARGVKRDYTEALAWLLLAKKRGSESSAEAAVRDRIGKLRHPEWIPAAEKRAAEIERELGARKPQEFLPAPAASGAAGPAAR